MRAVFMPSVAALAGCTSSTDNLQRATAMSVGSSPDRVTVANVERGISDVRWTADAGGRRYACSADDVVRRPSCVRQ